MSPCSPPMMFVSIVGQASFHTAAPSGPSMIDRSKRIEGRAALRGSAPAAADSAEALLAAAASLIDGSYRPAPCEASTARAGLFADRERSGGTHRPPFHAEPLPRTLPI